MKRLRFILLVFLCAATFLLAALCLFRIPITERIAAKALANSPEKISFSIERLGLGGIALTNIAVGDGFTLARAEARFSLADLIVLKRLEHVSVSGMMVHSSLSPEGLLSFPAFTGLFADKHSSESTGPFKLPVSIVSAAFHDLGATLHLEKSGTDIPLALSGNLLQKNLDTYQAQLLLASTDRCTMYLSGTFDVANGKGRFFPYLRVDSPEKLLENALSLPELPFAVSNLTVKASGSAELDLYATPPISCNIGIELGKNLALSIPAQDTDVEIRTCKLELSGTPESADAKLSVGFSKVRWKTLVEKGDGRRMFGLRGSLHYSKKQDGDNIDAELSGDIPGRTAARLLPRLLPFMPTLWSDGGNISAKTSVFRDNTSGKWQGNVQSLAEFDRASIVSKQGLLAFKSIAVDAKTEITNSLPTILQTDLSLNGFSFFNRNVGLRADAQANLRSLPPFESATGSFRASVSENRLPGVLKLNGDASVRKEDGEFLWGVSAAVPETNLCVTQGEVRASCLAGGTVQATYGAKTGDTSVSAEVHATNICVAAKGVSLEDMSMRLPVTWTPETGVLIPENSAALDWRKLDAFGLQLPPPSLSISNNAEAVFCDIALPVEKSAASLALHAAVPFTEPNAATVAVALVRTKLPSSDALIKLALASAPDVSADLEVSANASVSFLGKRPIVRGTFRLHDGSIVKDELHITGLIAEVPFAHGLFFRTQETPYIAFTNASFGKIVLDGGRAEFQLTPKEFFLEKASVAWCGGTIGGHCVHFRFSEPKCSTTLYFDKVDVGKLASANLPVMGKYSGVLYGRLPIGFEKGKLRFSDGFLYSMPGKGGSVRIDDPDDLEILLGGAGIAGDVRKPLANALGDMDFDVLKLDLIPPLSPGDDMQLSIKIGGKSNFKDWPAPIDLQLNLRGQLEDLVNFVLTMDGGE